MSQMLSKKKLFSDDVKVIYTYNKPRIPHISNCRIMPNNIAKCLVPRDFIIFFFAISHL